MFAFIFYVSIHLEISAAMVRSAPEKLPIRNPPQALEVTGRTLAWCLGLRVSHFQTEGWALATGAKQ